MADSAFVTGNNLDKAAETNTKFISRLPATYTECGRAIEQAARAGHWKDIGVISDSAPTPKRPPAYYQTYETTIIIGGRDYRAIVVHSSAHDKRRHKRIHRLLADKRKVLEEISKKTASSSYFCEPDARAAADKLAASASGSYHRLNIKVKENPTYSRGRPAADKPRVPKSYEYSLDIKKYPAPISADIQYPNSTPDRGYRPHTHWHSVDLIQVICEKYTTSLCAGKAARKIHQNSYRHFCG